MEWNGNRALFGSNYNIDKPTAMITNIRIHIIYAFTTGVSYSLKPNSGDKFVIYMVLGGTTTERIDVTENDG